MERECGPAVAEEEGTTVQGRQRAVIPFPSFSRSLADLLMDERGGKSGMEKRGA